MKLKQLVGAVTLTAAGVFSAASMAAIDQSLPTYEKTSGVSGNLSSVGSDTLANMMTLWAEEFKQMYLTSTSRSRLPVLQLRLQP